MGLVSAALIGLSFVGIAYQAFATYAVRRFAATRATPPTALPPVTLLKPVCGGDSGLYANLRSFCEQDYPSVQVVFGARLETDPAVAIVRRLMADLPQADLALVIDGQVHGANLKVSNLINMMVRARHDVLVLADSDMRVNPDYLKAVVAPLLEPGVGVVTCLYAGRPTGGLFATLGAMWINYGFLPSVLVSRRIGGEQGCFGATIALRRDTLTDCGGFAAVRDHLADDHALGAAAQRQGLRTELSRYVVDAMVDEPDFVALFRHELRWARTIRAIAPLGFASSVVTYPTVWAALACIVSGLSGLAILTLTLSLISRLLMVRNVDCALQLQPVSPILVPARDALSFLVLAVSFCGRKIEWRGRRFRMAADGTLIALSEPNS